MTPLAILAACAVAVAVFALYRAWKSYRTGRDHQAMMTALSPGPQILEMTTVRPNPFKPPRVAAAGQALRRSAVETEEDSHGR